MGDPSAVRGVSAPTVWTLLGLLLLSTGVAAASPATGPATPDAGAQPSDPVVEACQTTPTDCGETVSGGTGSNCRACHPSEAASLRDSGTTLNVSFTFRRLPDRPGIVGVTMRLPETPGVDGVSVEFREEVTVVDATNVDRNGSAYEWVGARDAEIVYRIPINWTYTGNRAASWTLVEHRPPSIDAGASVDVRGRVRLAEEGYVGNRTVLLGEHEVYQRRAAGQQIRVVVPKNVTLRNGAQRTVGALATAARSLSIGARDEVLHAFVTPEILTEATILFQPGFALDDDTLLVDGESEFDVWTHEYVHSRQTFPDTGRLRWLTEASAEYYGWLLSIEQGYDDWAELRGVFTRGASDDSVLADPETWQGETDYDKGGLVLGVIDNEIRVATDGQRTLQDVIRRVNRKERPTLETFFRAVRAVGGPDAAAAAERYVTTGAAPEYRPDDARLARIYGVSSTNGSNASPKVRTQIRGLSVEGQHGSTALDPETREVDIRPGESLRVRARVTNVGDAGGLASLAVREPLDDPDPDRTRIPWVKWIRPGESVERTETVQFGRPGEYGVVWGDRQYAVRVIPERGTASVTGVSATRNRSTDQVVVRATVRNDDERPTYAEFPVSLDGQRLTNVTAVVDGGTTRRVTLSVNVSRQEPYDLSIGGVSTTVGQQQATSRPETGFDLPLVPVVGVLGTLALLGGIVLWIVVKQ